jgi:cytochrome c5
MSGDYYWPCLVIRDNMVYSDNMGTTDRRWIYEWVVPGHFTGANGVAAAMSQNGASQDFINVETMMQVASCSIPDWDLNPPQFADTRVWPDTNYTGPFEVWSKITDDDVVGDESLFYRVNQGAWTSVEPDSEDGDTFFFAIPQVPPQSRVDYYVWAMDDYCEANDIECWTTWPVCSPESTMVTFNVNAVGLEGANPTRVEAALSASPNPFQDNVTFYYAVASARRAIVKVFSSSGELVRSIDMTRVPSVGFHASWDGRNEEGELVPAGTYLYRVETPTSIETRKVLLTR